MMNPIDWFDGHLDLTYLALHGRDLTRDVSTCGGGLQPASVTFPALRAAHVGRCCSTLFVRRQTADVRGAFCYDAPDEAHQAALLQLDMHRQWEQAAEISLEAAPGRPGAHDQGGLRATLAIEGAACIRTLEDADVFARAGVRVVSLAWAEGSAWAGGDAVGGDVTPEGRALVARLDELGIVHDVSHLSERAFWTLLECAKGPVIASHSNCRALLPGSKSPERHLSDPQIRALVSRGGIIGINLFARFLIPPEDLKKRRATAADVVRHITHIEQLAGRRDVIALGSDMDSGFGTDLLPVDVRGPGDLGRLAGELADAGWSSSEISRFAAQWQNLL